jgi:hypothetical protein
MILRSHPPSPANCINFSTWQVEKLMQFRWRVAVGAGLLALSAIGYVSRRKDWVPSTLP